jgi:hypothetical protein
MYWHESVENDSANRWLRQQIKSVLNPQTRAAIDSRRVAAKTSRRASRDDGGSSRRKRQH